MFDLLMQAQYHGISITVTPKQMISNPRRLEEAITRVLSDAGLKVGHLSAGLPFTNTVVCLAYAGSNWKAVLEHI